MGPKGGRNGRSFASIFRETRFQMGPINKESSIVLYTLRGSNAMEKGDSADD